MAEADAPRVRWSFPIAGVAGIHVRIHVTFLFLVALVAWLSSFPGGPGALAGVVWLLLVFACVVAHEFAHAFVARRRGVAVHEILLLPIGGVSKLEAMPERWNDELAIAIAGPAMSLGLGLGAAGAALLLGEALVPVDLLEGAFLVRLAWVNVILAAFNLLPAFPLDGGRVLRALFERRHDLETATRWAARAGRILAAAMIVVGLFTDVWLVLIGLFVFFGASAEERATIIHVRLAPLHVRDLMVPAVPVRPDAPAIQIGRLAEAGHQDLVLVGGDGDYLGACPTPALLAAAPGTTCSAVVDPRVPTIDAEAPLEGAVATLLHERAAEAVVLLEGVPAGLIRLDDVGDYLTAAPGRLATPARALVFEPGPGQDSHLRKDGRA